MVCVHTGTYSELDNALLRCDHLKFSKMAAGRHLEFDPTRNGAVRSAVPEKPSLEWNMKWIRWRVAEIWPFEIFLDIILPYHVGGSTRTVESNSWILATPIAIYNKGAFGNRI